MTEMERQQQLAELQAQVARLRRDHNERRDDRMRSAYQLYVVLGVGMLVVTVLAVAALSVLRPGEANLTTMVKDIMVPSAGALIAYGLQHSIRRVYHLADGNLSEVKRDLSVALGKIERLQEARLEEAQRTIPLVPEGDTLKIPPGAQGMIVDVKPKRADEAPDGNNAASG